MYQKLQNVLNTINKSKKIKCFFLGNTAKSEKPSFYVSDVRENSKFIFASAIIFNDKIAKKITRLIDGKVKYILLDTEKKVLSKSKKKIVNIEKTAKKEIKKSEIFTYKGNDLTVDAAETFIKDFYISDIRGVGGKKILIIGTGNIGFKLALKLVEDGANVFLYRRSKKVLKNITQSINFIKPKGTIAKAVKINFKNLNMSKFDIIVGATDGKSVLTKKHINNFNKKTFLLDIGKGILKKDALDLGIKKSIKLFRLDITPAYFGYLENVITTKKLSKIKIQNSRKINGLTLANKGILTSENTVIVDNIIKPKKIFGISDGFGDYKKISEEQEKKIKKKIIKKS